MRWAHAGIWLLVLATLGFFGYLLTFLIDLPEVVVSWGRRTWRTGSPNALRATRRLDVE